jgi:hypothetical protein
LSSKIVARTVAAFVALSMTTARDFGLLVGEHPAMHA